MWLELDVKVVVNKFYSMNFSLSSFDVIYVEALSLIYRLNIKDLRIYNKVIHNLDGNAYSNLYFYLMDM